MSKKKLKKKLRKSAALPSKKPTSNNWDIAISAAYLRLLGATQEEAAEAAGCGVRTIQTWEKCDWWLEATNEARHRWLKGGDALAMKAILQALKDPGEYAHMGRYWADRRIPELKPPKQQAEILVKNTWIDLVRDAQKNDGS